MVDYFPVLERAVAALDPNTREARRAVYDRARRALVDGLRASDPTLSDTDLKTQSMALEAAIRRVESEAARGEAPPGPPVPPPVQPPRREAPRVTVSHPQAAAPQPAPVRAAAPPPPPPPVAPSEPYEAPSASEYPDQPPLDSGGRRPWALIAVSLAVFGIVLMGAGAYTFWPRAAKPPAQRGAAATATDSGAAPYVYLRQPVYYRTTHPAGTIVVDKQQNFLYVVRPSVSALRYGIGVGPECKTAAGLYQIVRKEEWPGLKTADGKTLSDDERGKNPFGARALYLDKDGRVHGTNTPSSIGRAGAIGCFRLTNDDVIHLYERAPVDTRVIVIN